MLPKLSFKYNIPTSSPCVHDVQVSILNVGKEVFYRGHLELIGTKIANRDFHRLKTILHKGTSMITSIIKKENYF